VWGRQHPREGAGASLSTLPTLGHPVYLNPHLAPVEATGHCGLIAPNVAAITRSIGRNSPTANEPFSWTGKVAIDGIEELWTVRAISAQDLQDRRRRRRPIRTGAPAEPHMANQERKPAPTCSLCNQPAEYKQGVSGNPPRKWKAWRCPTHGIINFNQSTNTWDPRDP
jgi:hypothetical protein